MEKNWLQLSDLHLVRVYTGKNDQTGVPDVKRAEFISAVLSRCGDHMFQGKHIDFVVISGDFRNIFDRDSDGFSDAVTFIRTLFDQDHLAMDLNKELFLIPGNHDNNRDSEYEDAAAAAAASDETQADSGMSEKRRDIIAGLLPEGYGEIREKANRLRTASGQEKAALEKELEEYKRTSEKEPGDLLKRLQNACVKTGKELLIQPFSAFDKELAQKLIPAVYSDDYRASSVHVRTLCTSAGAPYLNMIHLNTAIAADGSRCHYQFADLTAFSELIENGAFDSSVPSLILAHNSFYDLHPSVREELRKLMELANVWAWLCGDAHKRNRYDENSVIPRLSASLPYLAWPNLVCSKSSADVSDDYSDFGMLCYSWDSNLVKVEALDWDPRGTDIKRASLLSFPMNAFCSSGLLDFLLARLEKDRRENPSFQLVYHSEDHSETDRAGLLREEIRPELIPLAKLTVRENNAGTCAPQNLRALFKKSWSRDRQNHLLIEGEGGIGKTVSLLTLALEDGLFPYLVPAIYIPLRSLPFSEDKDLLGKYIREEICGGRADIWEEIRALSEENWNNGPRLILLIDGFNEVDFIARGRVTDSISNWANKYGVQVIMTSRLDGAFSWSKINPPVQRVRLQPLSREMITDYLKSKNIAVPKAGNPIWNVIDLPLLLVLYANVIEQKRRFRSTWLCWEDGNTAGALIWNYLQTEIQRFRDLGYSGEKLFSVVCLLEYIAPEICWQMVQNQGFSANVSGFEISEEQYDSCFEKALEWFRQLLDSGQNARLNTLTGLYRRETRKRFSGFSDQEAGNLQGMLKEEINLFRPAERNGKPYYTLMHQNFRDCLAAVYLLQQIGCLGDNELEDWRKNSVNAEVLCYLSELINKEKETILWETNRTCAKEAAAATRNLLRLEKYLRTADYSELNFQGMNLEQVPLRSYTDRQKKIHLPTDGSLLENTKLGFKSLAVHGHSDRVSCVAVTPDGRGCVSGSWDSSLRVWDMDSGELLRIMEGHGGRITCLAVTPDGTGCVSGSDDQTLRVWDLGSGELQFVLAGHDSPITCLAVTPDGSRCVSGSWDRTLRIWDMNSGRLMQLGTPGCSVSCVAVTPDGTRCVVGCEDYTLRIWNLDSGGFTHVLGGHYGKITCLAVSPDSRRCVTGSTDHLLCVWDMNSGELLHVLERHRSAISCIAAAPGSSVCVSGSGDGMLGVWDMDSGALLQVLKGHADAVKCVAVNAGGSRCVSGSRDQTLRIWDMNSGELKHVLRGFDGTVRCAAVSPDGSRCVAGSTDHTLRIWDTKTGELSHALVGYDGVINCLALTADGSVCVTGADDHTLRIWDMEQGLLKQVLVGYDGIISCVAVTPDGTKCVAGSGDGTLRVWDTESGGLLQVLEGHCLTISCVAVTPDGTKCVSASDDDTLRIWDMESGELRHILTGHRIAVSCVAVTPDGTKCVSGSFDKTLRIWDMESGELLQVLEGQGEAIRYVTVSPDGSRCISGSDDGRLCIWDMESGRLLQVLRGYVHEISSVTKAADGPGSISGSENHMLRIWDMENENCAHFLVAHDHILCCAAATPAGSKCASDAHDHTLRIWNLERRYHIDLMEKYDHSIRCMAMSRDGKKCVFGTDRLNMLDMNTNKLSVIQPLYGVNVIGVDFSKAIIDEDVRIILQQNGAKC